MSPIGLPFSLASRCGSRLPAERRMPASRFPAKQLPGRRTLHSSVWQLIGIAVIAMIGAARPEVAGAATDDMASRFFHEQVLPIFQQHCYACHSHGAGRMESQLALDWRSGWETGGSRGPAVIPGDSERSLLMRAVEHRDAELKMPEERLSDAEIKILQAWIQQGAYDDRAAAPVAVDRTDWWSLRPLVAPAIPLTSRVHFSSDELVDQKSTVPRAWPGEHPIDAFIAAGLESAQLTPSELASPRDQIRRLYFDLIGLPPDPNEVDRFVAAPSEESYQRIVDQLLASPRYGERWARHWFDTIHFADSHGYEHDVGRDHAWPYRDYVITALNQDVPWSTFIRQQLAVDYFQPEATELLPALGFLGAGPFDLSTYSTGPVTFDYLDRDDMLTQTISALISTTVNCARCHDHKFDPVSQEDYYALQAVFAGVLKGDITYDRTASIAAERRDCLQLQAAAQQREATVLQTPRIQQLVAEWLDARGGGADWRLLELESFTSTSGATLTRGEEGVLVVSGSTPDTDTYVLTGTSPLPQVTALRLDLFPHDSLPMRGPGRSGNGNLHLSEVEVQVFSPGAPAGQRVAIAGATADFNQAGWSIDRALDADLKTAWGIHPAVGEPHHAVFQLAQPLSLAAGSRLTVTLRQLHGTSHLLGTLKLSVSSADAAQAEALPREVAAILARRPAERTTEQQQQLAAHVTQRWATARLAQLPSPAAVYAVGHQVTIPAGNGGYQAAQLSAPKEVHLLRRGDIGQPGPVVGPGALTMLKHASPRFGDSGMLSDSERRAALADWLAHPGNVLTWRSIVNRVWHYHFGRGLCDTPSDFGRMGGLPSHPELLDWLAVWFRDEAHGSLKRLHRLIVTSHTYRQSSLVRDELADRDTDNRWLWRQHHRRIDADTYRDAVLAVSGQLDLQMGGPAVQQFHQSPGPQATPKLDYAAFDWSIPGAGRRAIYRYVWRGIPDPLLAALDFPDLGLLSPQRGLSASPLQALALYNNDFVLFHSSAMAQRVCAAHSDVEEQITWAVRLAYQRDPSRAEIRLMQEFSRRHGLAACCRVLLNSNEFFFVP